MESKEMTKAREAYERYGATTDFKNFQGLDMPAWQELPERIHQAWVAAANPSEPTENLNFSQAFAALLRGQKIARAIWGGFWFTSYSSARPTGLRELQGQTLNLGELILASLKDGGYAPAQPYQADLLANDWKIIS